MKTLEQVLQTFKSNTLDGRDAGRLMQFVPESRLSEIGISLKEEFVGTHVEIPFTRDNILAQLEKDVAFGFEKALKQRGISSSLMYEVVMMWNSILEEGLEGFDNYPMYGLPLFKATAIKYGWENPIDADTGSEDFYNA